MNIQGRFCCSLDLGEGHITGFSVGPDQRLYVLICYGRPENGIERQQDCGWRVFSIDSDGECFDYYIPKAVKNFDRVQPLPDGLLLATSRCRFADDNTTPNGQVFDSDGRPVRSILLGDGIHSMQTTASGSIWLSYFDEGVFGNLGWRQPIGSSGLRRLDSSGESTFEFQPAGGLDRICDCYCLNIVSERDAWCCYYTDFPIVRIEGDRIASFWNSPISGATGMAIWRSSLLMHGGYGSNDWKLLRLMPSGNAEIIASYEFRGDLGQTLKAQFATCRGDAIWFLESGNIYRLALRELPALAV